MGIAQVRDEVRMVASSIGGLFLGRTVWLPIEDAPDTSWTEGIRKSNMDVVRGIYQERLRFESEGIESVRRRSEFALTAIIAAVGLSASAYEQLWKVSRDNPWPLIVWAIGVFTIVASVLVFAGVAVSKKVLGVVDVASFAGLKDSRAEEVRQYVKALHTTSRTRRALVTVFRDGFLVALLGLSLLAAGHMISWVLDPSALCLDCHEESPGLVRDLDSFTLNG